MSFQNSEAHFTALPEDIKIQLFSVYFDINILRAFLAVNQALFERASQVITSKVERKKDEIKEFFSLIKGNFKEDAQYDPLIQNIIKEGYLPYIGRRPIPKGTYFLAFREPTQSKNSEKKVYLYKKEGKIYFSKFNKQKQIEKYALKLNPQEEKKVNHFLENKNILSIEEKKPYQVFFKQLLCDKKGIHIYFSSEFKDEIHTRKIFKKYFFNIAKKSPMGWYSYRNNENYAYFILRNRKTNSRVRQVNYFLEKRGKVNFSFSHIKGMQFSGSQLANANFYHATLSLSLFDTAVLEESNFNHTKIYCVNFKKANMTRSSFQNSYLEKVYFTSTNLNKANFRQATIGSGENDPFYSTDRPAYLIALGAYNLKIENMSNDLNFLHSQKHNMFKISFDKAILNDAQFNDAIINNASFYHATLNRNNFSGASLTNLFFTDSTLTEATFENAKLTNTSFNYVSLNSVNFKNTSFKNVSFGQAKLNKACFFKSTFIESNFSYNNLENANFLSATFKKVDFKSANLEGSDFTNTVMIDPKNLTVPQLLSSASIMGLKIQKGVFSDEDLKDIKIKMVQDYKNYFDRLQNPKDILSILNDILIDETHTLKILRGTRLRSYGNTDSLSAVIRYGRLKIIRLLKNKFYADFEPVFKNAFARIFSADIDSLSAKFFGEIKDNSKEILDKLTANPNTYPDAYKGVCPLEYFFTQDNKPNSYQRTTQSKYNFFNKSLFNSNFSDSTLDNMLFRRVDLMRANFSNTTLKESDFIHTNLNYVNFSNAKLVQINFDKANLSNVNLTNAYIIEPQNLTVQQLLSAASIRGMKIQKGLFYDFELKAIKIKMVQDYKNYFDRLQNPKDILSILNDILKDETHTLKILREAEFRSYGNTDSLSAVMTYGRKRLTELLIQNPDTFNIKKHKDALAPIFNADIYSWHTKFTYFGKPKDNATEVFKALCTKIKKQGTLIPSAIPEYHGIVAERYTVPQKTSF